MYKKGALPAVALLLCALLVGCVTDVDSDQPFGSAGDGTLGEVLESFRSQNGLPALAGMIVHQGRVVEMAAVGVRRAGFPDAIRVTDLWHLESITKSMTSTLVARLVEQGIVSWGTTVSQALPDLAERIRPEYADVTMEELLTHTSGMPNDLGASPIVSTHSRPDDLAAVVVERHELAAQLLELLPVGARGDFLYANNGYVVAGAMLEALTGEAWETLMRRELFQPLGITSGGFGPPGDPERPDQPWGHYLSRPTWIPEWSDNASAIGPAGTVHISMEDMAKYMAAHLAGARGEAGGILEPESFERLHTPPPQSKPCRDSNCLFENYAKGWGVAQGGAVLTHNGSNGLWLAWVWLSPEKDVGVFVVSNAGQGFEGTNGARSALLNRINSL